MAKQMYDDVRQFSNPKSRPGSISTFFTHFSTRRWFPSQF